MRGHLIQQIDLFLNGESSVGALVDWVSGHFQTIVDTGDAIATALAGVVEGAFFQLGEGVLTVDQLREDIAGAQRRMCIISEGPEPFGVSNASTIDVGRHATPAPMRTLTESDLLIPLPA